MKKTVDKTIVFAADLPAATISVRARRGELARLAAGVYTTDVTADSADVVAREWHTIAGHMFPDAVISDRSAVTGGPVDGYTATIDFSNLNTATDVLRETNAFNEPGSSDRLRRP